MPDKNSIYIIVAGHSIAFDHRKIFDKPRILSFYGPGDIIGDENKDNNISGSSSIWI